VTETYTAESRVGDNIASPATSEFIWNCPEQCSLLLQQLVRAGSDIDHKNFVIFDARSQQDETLLVVGKEILTEDEEAEDASVRMIFEMVNFSILMYLAAVIPASKRITKNYRYSPMRACGHLSCVRAAVRASIGGTFDFGEIARPS
ncbi:hypothetical protein LTR56_026903, partial [Elasticomyces elasticus]